MHFPQVVLKNILNGKSQLVPFENCSFCVELRRILASPNDLWNDDEKITPLLSRFISSRYCPSHLRQELTTSGEANKSRISIFHEGKISSFVQITSRRLLTSSRLASRSSHRRQMSFSDAKKQSFVELGSHLKSSCSQCSGP